MKTRIYFAKYMYYTYIYIEIYINIYIVLCKASACCELNPDRFLYLSIHLSIYLSLYIYLFNHIFFLSVYLSISRVVYLLWITNLSSLTIYLSIPLSITFALLSTFLNLFADRKYKYNVMCETFVCKIFKLSRNYIYYISGTKPATTSQCPTRNE